MLYTMSQMDESTASQRGSNPEVQTFYGIVYLFWVRHSEAPRFYQRGEESRVHRRRSLLLAHTIDLI